MLRTVSSSFRDNHLDLYLQLTMVDKLTPKQLIEGAELRLNHTIAGLNDTVKELTTEIDRQRRYKRQLEDSPKFEEETIMKLEQNIMSLKFSKLVHQSKISAFEMSLKYLTNEI